MRFLSQNRGILTRILRLLGIGQLPEQPLDIEPVLIGNSPEMYSEFQYQENLIASGVTPQTKTFGNLLDTRKEVFITAITMTCSGPDLSFATLYGIINGVEVPLCFAAGFGLTLAGANGATQATISFPVPKKIDLIANNIALRPSGSPASAACVVHGYQV